MRVRPSGTKTYVAAYRHGRRLRWATIGKHGNWAPDDARARAKAILREADEGKDPASGKRAVRAAPTVADLIDAYLLDGPIDKPNKRASSWATDRSNLNRHLRPLLGARIARELTQADISVFQRDVGEGKSRADIKTKRRGRAIVKGGDGTARRSVITAAAMFQWAVGRKLIGANPAKGVQLLACGARERFLTAGELATLLATIDEMTADGSLPGREASALKLLVFTGCRKTEIIGLRWREVDFSRRALSLPAERDQRLAQSASRSILCRSTN